MSDYRNYTRAAAGFNGVTPDAAVYSGTRFAFTTTTATAVGVFSPAQLGRRNIASACRVMLQGAIVLGDTVSVIDTSGQVRFSLPASLESSGWFFLGPQDSVRITSLGATSADILVADLQDSQLQEFIRDEVLQGLVGVPAPAPLITGANPYTVLAFDEGTFYLTGTPGAAAIVNLTTVSDFSVGARIVYFNNSAFNVTITPPLGELINGAVNIVLAAGATASIEAAGTQWIAII